MSRTADSFQFEWVLGGLLGPLLGGQAGPVVGALKDVNGALVVISRRVGDKAGAHAQLILQGFEAA